MKVDMIIPWVGSVEVPEKLQGKGPFEVSCADLAELVKTNDVAYLNQNEGVLALAIDVKGKGFRQR